MQYSIIPTKPPLPPGVMAAFHFIFQITHEQADTRYHTSQHPTHQPMGTILPWNQGLGSSLGNQHCGTPFLGNQQLGTTLPQEPRNDQKSEVTLQLLFMYKESPLMTETWVWYHIIGAMLLVSARFYIIDTMIIDFFKLTDI